MAGLLAFHASSGARQTNTSSLDEHTGSVSGTVTDEEGKPSTGATAYAHPMDRPMMGIVPQSRTDAAGHFKIEHLWWGRYGVSAAKKEDGYPEVFGEFFARKYRPQIVTLGPDHPNPTVTIRLGPKAGVLTGTVTDAATAAPLDVCSEFRWASDPNNFMSGSGLVNAEFRVLMPPDTALLWKVWADGYKPWYYPGTTDKKAAMSVVLRPGEVRTMKIELQPDAAAVSTGCGMPVGTVIRP